MARGEQNAIALDRPLQQIVDSLREHHHDYMPGRDTFITLGTPIVDPGSDLSHERNSLDDLNQEHAHANNDTLDSITSNIIDLYEPSQAPEPPPRNVQRLYPTKYSYVAQQDCHRGSLYSRIQDHTSSLYSRYHHNRMSISSSDNLDGRLSHPNDFSHSSAIPPALIVPRRVAEIEAVDPNQAGREPVRSKTAKEPLSGDSNLSTIQDKPEKGTKISSKVKEEKTITPKHARNNADDAKAQAPPSASIKAIKAHSHNKSKANSAKQQSGSRPVSAHSTPPSLHEGRIEPDSVTSVHDATAKQLPPLPPMPTAEELEAMRDPSTISRGRSHMRRASRNLASAGFTAGDLLVPPNQSIKDVDARTGMTTRTLGQSIRSRSKDFEKAEEMIGGHDENRTIRKGSPPPDGGRLAWAMAVAGFFVTFNTWGLNTSFGAFQAFYSIVLLPEESLEKIAWIGSMQLFLMFFLGTPIGLALDHGWFRVFFNGGTLILLAGVFSTSFCTKWWHFFLAQGFLTGLGQGMVFCSGVITLMSYFSSNMGKAMAFGVTGASFGAIIYPLMFKSLIDGWGFAWTVRFMGFLALATMIYPTMIVRRRRGHRPAARAISMEAYHDKAFLVMTAGMFFAFWGMYFATYSMVLYSMVKLGKPGTQAINLLIVMSAGNLVGRLLPGMISDACTGPLNLVIPSCVFAAFMTFLWIASDSFSSLIGVACFYGFFSAGIQALYTPTLHSFGHERPETMGQKSGLVFTVVSVACLTGTPIGGMLITAGKGNFLGAQIFAGGSLIIGAAFLLWSRWLKIGWQAARV